MFYKITIEKYFGLNTRYRQIQQGFKYTDVN